MMQYMWEKEYSLRACDFDRYNHILPSSVLELFQDAAGQHSEIIGCGSKSMLRRSYMWVVLRIKFQIISNPKSYQKVIVKTWPLAPGRASYRREYCIENEKGEKLIIGSSEWVIMHSEKRTLVPDAVPYPFADGFLSEQMFSGRLGKIKDFEENGEPKIVNAGFCDLDINNHVNNTKYAKYVLDAVVPKETDILKTFQIDYKKEVLAGTQLRIYHQKEENAVVTKGLNDNGDTMFTCKLEYE